MTRKYNFFTGTSVRALWFNDVPKRRESGLTGSHHSRWIVKRAFCYTWNPGTTVVAIAIRPWASAVTATSKTILQSPATFCTHLQRLRTVFTSSHPFVCGSNIIFHRTELLKDEFLTVPVRHITNVLKIQKTLYKAYGVIEQQVRNYGQIARTYSKINKSRIKRGIEVQLIEQGSQIPKELHAARKKSEAEASKCDAIIMIFLKINKGSTSPVSWNSRARAISFICSLLTVHS